MISNIFEIMCKVNNISGIFILLVIMMSSLMGHGVENARQMLDKTASGIIKSKTLEAKFTINGNKPGVMRVSGKKFYVTAMGSSSWYDGKSLYTYNSSTKETTVVTPSKSELSEANPMSYISGAANGYNLSFGKNNSSDYKTIIMVPKRKHDPVKRVEVTINSRNYSPVSIRVYPKSGVASTLKITSLKLGIPLSSSFFIYPKNKYANIKIIDLR